MASTKLVFLAIAVLLLQASWCAVSLQYYAKMVWTSFQEDGGNGPVACDGKYHDDRAPIVALSPRSYADGSRCYKSIDIMRIDTGKTVRATVVDAADAPDNTVATTSYVWELLGFGDHNIGEVFVYWHDAE